VLDQEPPIPLPRQATLGFALRARRSRILLLAPLLLLAGCAGVAEVAGPATQQDLLQVRSDLTTLQLQIQRAKTDADALSGQVDRRLRDQGAENERQIGALSRRLEGLASTLTALSTKMDEMSGRLDALSRQARNAPPRAGPPAASPPPVSGAPLVPGAPPVAGGPPAGAGTPPVAAVPPPQSAPQAPTSRPATGPLQPKDIYQAAYIDFSKGSYTLAIAGFREFLRRFPDHELADDAQYWVGEAYFSLARGYGNAGQGDKAAQSLEQAVQEFKKVVANYPRGEKTPTALYKEALALIELKQPELAQSRLQYLVENFPQAAETPLARERLASLKER
jgi:tol-pal system protein YbgF